MLTRLPCWPCSPHPTSSIPAPNACSNVLLDEELRAYISDFGVARVVGQSARSVAGFHWVHAGGPPLYCYGLCRGAVCMVLLKPRGGLHAQGVCSMRASGLLTSCVRESALLPTLQPPSSCWANAAPTPQTCEAGSVGSTSGAGWRGGWKRFAGSSSLPQLSSALQLH